jgi:hypothetical protein
MKPRSAIFALVLAGLAAPTLVAAQVPIAPPPAKFASPGDLPCLLRMMHLSMMAKNSAQDQTKEQTSRSTAQSISEDARHATFFYIARLGPNWSSTSRAPEAEVEFKKMMAMPQDKLAAEMAVCLTDATDAEQKALNAMAPKKN